MSSSNRRPVLVGLFVAVAIAILAGGVLAVGNLHDTFSTKIRVHAVFHDVNGLQAGDNVWCSGLKVGVVDSLEFVDIERIQVDMLLGRDVATFIHADAKAHIGSDGLIGNPIVVLTGGTADAPALQDDAMVESEAPEALMATFQKVAGKVSDLTDHLTTVVKGIEDGEGTVGKLLKDEELYAGVRQTVDELQVASANARKLTASLARFSADLNAEGHLPHEIATDEKLFTSIATSVQNLQDATAKASAALGTAQDVAQGVQQGATDPNTTVGMLLHDPQTAAELKQTIAGIQKASVLLQEDLKALQSNFLFRGYFKKREREARKAARGED